MGFLSRLTERKKREGPDEPLRPKEDAVALKPGIRDEEIPGTLDLGWYWSENKEEFQMAKIAESDRATHMYVVGATRAGKTKFLEFLIQQDIDKGNGFGIIDPHGDLIEDIKGFLACRYEQNRDEKEISERVVLIDPTNPENTVTFNPLEKLPGASMAEEANELVSAFRKIWPDAWGVRMEDLMRNSLIALGEAGLTLAELPRFLTERAFREGVVRQVEHPIARQYFQRFDALTDRGQLAWIEPVMNKVNAFLADERIRQVFSSSKSSFNLREIMDGKKMLLIKLDKGRLKDSADLLGSLLMAKIQMAAFSRSDVPESKRTPFYLYIDEFQNFATESFMVVLSEARKYGLSLIMAHQTLAQIPRELTSLILGNAGVQVYFRINRQDAQLLAKEGFEYSGYEVKSVSLRGHRYWSLAEEWEQHIGELQNLPPRTCYVKHKIEGGIIPLYTVEIEPPWEVLGMTEDKFQEFLEGLPFGRKYLIAREEILAQAERGQKLIREEMEARLREEKPAAPSREAGKKEGVIQKEERPKASREEEELSSEEGRFLEFVSQHPGMFVTQIYKALALSGYKGDKLKGSLIERDLIVQEETREGRAGRLAKILALTDKGNLLLKKLPQGGKGGEDHRYLQLSLKEQAEVYGWKATIEERIPRSLESVDVGLRKDDLRVAIEISSTSRAGQEIQNIRKCLEEGYDYVLCVCSDAHRLGSLKKEAGRSLTLRERERIRFYQPSRVKGFLQSLALKGIVSENGIVSGQISREKELLDTREAARFLGISKNTLYEWVVQRKIPFVKVGRLVKFRPSELEAWLKKRTRTEREDYI